MVSRKRVIETTVLTGALALTATTAGLATADSAKQAAEVTVTQQEVQGENNRTAGVILQLGKVAESAFGTMTVSMEQTGDTKVAAGEEVAEEAVVADATEAADADTVAGTLPEEVTGEVAQTEETASDAQSSEWDNKLVADVDKYLNVRAEASEDSDVLGKLYVGSAADIVEVGDTWTLISSGDVNGYVLNDYCLTGQQAYEYAQSNCETKATALTGGLRVRSNPSEDAEIVDTIAEGDVLTVDTDTDAGSEWVAVIYDGETEYVSAQYVDVALDVGTAVTLEQEDAMIKEEAKTSQVAASGNTTQNASVSASIDDVTLLAALIQSEAGAESYDGQLAVGAVVMNRLRSGRYGSSLSSVIYAPGQFTPAGSGTVARIAASGVKAVSLQAAQDALNGSDNTGGATSFRSVWSGHAGVVIGNHVFW